jgi:hypothetical protein
MVPRTNTNYEEYEWYADNGANAHITNSLENLNVQQSFEKNDVVEVGNGMGLAIENFGSSTLQYSSSSFHLKKNFTLSSSLC